MKEITINCIWEFLESERERMGLDRISVVADGSKNGEYCTVIRSKVTDEYAVFSASSDYSLIEKWANEHTGDAAIKKRIDDLRVERMKIDTELKEISCKVAEEVSA